MNLSSLSLLLFAALTAIVLALLLVTATLGRLLFGRGSRRRIETPPLLIRRHGTTGLHVTSRDDEPATLDASFERLVRDSDVSVSPVQTVLFALVVAALVGGAALLWFDNPITGLLAALLAMVLLLPLLQFRRGRRRQTLREQLPMVFDLLARASRAGQSLDQSIELVGDQFPAPWGPQFRITSRQLDAGLSVQAAIAALYRRTRIDEIQDLVTVLTVYRQTGGNLALMLERLAANARDRLDFQRQFRAATAGARFATVTITASFVVVFAFLFLYETDYNTQFFREPEGVAIFAGALALLLFGLWWINRVLRVDY